MAKSLSSIADQMAEYGIVVPSLDCLYVTNGSYARFTPAGEKRKMCAWFVIYENIGRNGQKYYAGSFGCKGDGPYKIVADKSSSASERADFSTVDVEAQRKTEVNRDRMQAIAAKKAETIWAHASEEKFLIDTHPYLQAKKCRAYGLRVSGDGSTLMIPVNNRGRLVGLQFIKQLANASFEKKFLSYTEMVGAHYVIGELNDKTQTVFVCEGYATGAAIYEATKVTTVCAFNCGNLIKVVARLRQKFPDLRIINAADDDRHIIARAIGFFDRTYDVRPRITETKEAPTKDRFKDRNGGFIDVSAAIREESGVRRVVADYTYTDEKGKLRNVTKTFENAGRKAAAELWKKYGVASVYPKFADRKSAGTDFDDLLIAEGLGTCKTQLEYALHAGDREINSELNYDWALDRFVLIYGTSTVWDKKTYRVVQLGALKEAWPDTIKAWQRDSRRRMVLPDQLVFEPSGVLKDGEINMFESFGVRADSSKNCQLIIDHLKFLCGGKKEEFEWVSRWLAYPLQHPGAKMHTALVMHGIREGTGKNIFFSVMEKIYGDYSSVINQNMLNSDFNGYLSRKLFIVADEVLSAQDKRHQKGVLKGMVTGDRHAINEKNMPVRYEKNYTNFVFLSNELQPLVLDPHDRRYMTLYVDTPRPPEYYVALAEQIEHGGVEAFYAWLLSLDLGDFSPATRPIHNEAHHDLVELGKPASDRFIDAWLAGDTVYPVSAVTIDTLYEAFTQWRSASGELSKEPKLQFTYRCNKRDFKKKRARVELWPAWYDPDESMSVQPAKERRQTQVYFPSLEYDDSNLQQEVLDFQLVVNHVRKESKRS